MTSIRPDPTSVRHLFRSTQANVFKDIDLRATTEKIGDERWTCEDYQNSVDEAIKTIERASNAVDFMKDKVSDYENTIYMMRKEIAELNSQKEGALQELVKAEKAIRLERERANRAESEGARSKEQASTLSAQLNRIMSAVTSSFADHTQEGYGEERSPSFVS